MNTHCPLRPIHFRIFFVIGLCCYALPGLISHAPWKPDDAVHIGLVLNQLKYGLSWFPEIIGSPNIADGPLTTWVSTLFVKCLGGFWPFELAGLIRLPNLLYLGLLTWCAMRIGEQYNSLCGKFALPLLIIGAVGLLVPAHETGAALPTAACWMIGYYGLTRNITRPIFAGMLSGLALSSVFLMNGIEFDTWILLLMPLIGLFRTTEGHIIATTHTRLRFILSTFLFAIIPSGIWVFCTIQNEPDIFLRWQIIQISQLQQTALSADHVISAFKLISWTAFPAWPLAIYTLFSRRSFWREEKYWLPLTIFGSTLMLLFIFGTANTSCAILPMLPLAILGADRIHVLPASLSGLLGWFSMLAFTLIGLYGWIAWSAMVLHLPSRFSAHLEKIFPAFTYPKHAYAAVALTLTISVCWIVLIVSRRKTPLKDLVDWSAGLTMLWALGMWLHLPLLDHLRSYQNVAEALVSSVPKNKQQCISGQQVGAAQRASIQYFTNIELQPDSADCTYRFQQGIQQHPEPDLLGWQKILEIRRHKHKREIYRLYRRQPKSAPSVQPIRTQTAKTDTH